MPIYDYKQSGDPGAVGAGKSWLDTDDWVLRVRNSSDSAWVDVGNINSPNLGALPSAGGEMTGAITGTAHGLATIANPNFTGSLKLNGVNVLTQNDIDTAFSTLRSEFASRIASAVSTAASTTSIMNRVAVDIGVIEFNEANAYSVSLTCPYYKDSNGNPIAQAQPEECVHGISLLEYNAAIDQASAFNMYYRKSGLNYTYYVLREHDGAKFHVKATYIIIGLRDV